MKTTYKYVSVVLLAFLLAACSHRLPEEKMIAVLTDFYVYEDLLSLANVTPADSFSIPRSILEKHQVSPELFDETLRYYLSKPKALKKLHEKMYADLKQRVSDYTQAIEDTEMSLSLWQGIRSQHFDTLQLPQPLAFYMPVDSMGNFTMKASVQLYEDDSTGRPEMVGYFLRRIDSVTVDTLNRKTLAFARSPQSMTQALAFSVNDTSVFAFAGYWLQVQDDTVPRRQHISLDKLRVLYDNDPANTISADVRPKPLRRPPDRSLRGRAARAPKDSLMRLLQERKADPENARREEEIIIRETMPPVGPLD
jgi:hypothetical protein